jgi:CRISPR-associated protein Csb1
VISSRAVPNVTHVVWDWNGTLLADTPLTVGAVNAALEAVGGQTRVSVERWREISVRPVDNAYRELLGRWPSAAEWETIKRVWLETYEATDPPLAADGLAALRAASRNGLTQSVVSLHVLEPLLARMEILGVRRYFSKVSAASARQGAGGIRTKAELLAAHLDELGQLGLVSCRQITRSRVLSFATLRQIRFGKGAAGDAALRSVLAAIALNGIARADAELFLRAHCHLVEAGPSVTEVDRRHGQVEAVSLPEPEEADALLAAALDHAAQVAELDWHGQVFEVDGDPAILAGSVDDSGE